MTAVDMHICTTLFFTGVCMPHGDGPTTPRSRRIWPHFDRLYTFLQQVLVLRSLMLAAVCVTEARANSLLLPALCTCCDNVHVLRIDDAWNSSALRNLWCESR